MFESSTTAPRLKPPSKDAILKQADGLRDLARRSRRLSHDMTNESDQRRLERHVDELEESASRLEKAAVEARTG